jgi:phosphoribosylformylglycinamidine synthase subunit PurQ / glutaminase
MKAGVVIFPGSNCDQDMIDALSARMGWDVVRLWHKEAALPTGLDLIVLPGGFSYGDHLRAGAIARFSPVMKSVVEFAAGGHYVLGVCNGFQILTEAGLLPGALHRNASLRFICRDIHLRVENPDTPFTAGLPPVIRVPIAHGEGNYAIDEQGLKRLRDERGIVFRYCDAEGKISPKDNPNGSVEAIAGVCNAARNVLGMMPHPERACDGELGGEDGRGLLGSIENAVKKLLLAT